MTVWSIDRLRRMAAGLVLATLLAGCLPESEHPIAAADPAKNDARLWGSWISEAEDGYMIAHVFATEKDTLSISLAEHGVEGLGEIETYDVHVTNLPSGDYINVVTTGSEAGYLVGKYQFDGTDAVSVWFPGNEALEQAVTSGKLTGTTKVEGGMTDVRITASPEQWQAFLIKPPAGFFDEPISFKRIGPAYVEQQ
ncbi:MAG: hypothetical protein HC861_04790 [Rhodospirillaceae bacterium]|nr:hypothetical protein [Rhodospirillaceae bacterium]